MRDARQQAYDRGITIFSPDGRLYQVEYAREAVKQGTPSVGVRGRDGVVLAAARPVRSPLQVADSVEKLHHVDDRIAIASAGHAADARRLVDVARRRAQAERLRYGEPIGVETLTKAVTDHVQEYTQTGGGRPFGTALLVGGIDENGARLFEADPSGTPFEWRAAAIGRDGDDIRARLEDGYGDDLALDEGVELALSALSEPEGDLHPDRVSVATVGDGGFATLSAEERLDVLERLDILEDGPAS